MIMKLRMYLSFLGSPKFSALPAGAVLLHGSSLGSAGQIHLHRHKFHQEDELSSFITSLKVAKSDPGLMDMFDHASFHSEATVLFFHSLESLPPNASAIDTNQWLELASVGTHRMAPCQWMEMVSSLRLQQQPGRSSVRKM